MGRPASFDHAEAVRLYAKENWRTDALARRYGVSCSAVRQLMQRSGVRPHRGPRADSKIDPVEAVRLYVEERLLLKEIAMRFDVSVAAVSMALRRHRGGQPRPCAYDRAPMALLLAHGATIEEVAWRLEMSPGGIWRRLRTMGATARTLRRDLMPLKPKQLKAYGEALDGASRLSHADALDIAMEY